KNKHVDDSLGAIRRGAVCVTSTHPGTSRALGYEPIPIEGLDPAASESLILWRALGKDGDPGEEGKLYSCPRISLMADRNKVRESARQAAKVLHGFPLGLELAGILIHEGIVSLNAFPAM